MCSQTMWHTWTYLYGAENISEQLLPAPGKQYDIKYSAMLHSL